MEGEKTVLALAQFIGNFFVVWLFFLASTNMHIKKIVFHSIY